MENIFRKGSKQSERLSVIEGYRPNYLEKAFTVCKPLWRYLEIFGRYTLLKPYLLVYLNVMAKVWLQNLFKLLMAKCEAVLKSQPWTVQTISDVNS